MQKRESWRAKAINYLNGVIEAPSRFSLPTWIQLQKLTSKSKATLWRDKTIYDRYLAARQARSNWSAKAKATKSSHRRTLEERISFLEHELRKANVIIDAHILRYQQISSSLQLMNIDPLVVMNDPEP